jgi:hypothetical protein
MATQTTFGTKIQEGETWTYQATIVDETGAAVDLTAATVNGTVDFYYESTNVSINSRLNQAVIAAGVPAFNHTVTAGGVITWKAAALDSVVTGGADSPVIYRLEIDYNDGAAIARTLIHEIKFTIEALPTVT